MGNIFDVILILVIVSIIITCYKLGFFKLLKPFRKIAAFLLALSLKDSALVTGTVGRLIKADSVKTFLNGRIEALWGEKLRSAAGADGVSVAERFDEVFGFTGKLFANLKNFCVSLYDKDLAASVTTESTLPSEKIEEFVMEVTDYITSAAVGFFTALIGFILLYIIFSVGFWFAAKLLDGIFSDGVFGLINRCLGGAVGICYGFLAAWVLSIVFVLIFPLITSISLESITGGAMGVTRWMYTEFFLSKLLGIAL